MLVMMLLRVADNACLALVNRVNSVNLSTNLKNPAANTNARVLCPVSFRNTQGPRQPTGRWEKSGVNRRAPGSPVH